MTEPQSLIEQQMEYYRARAGEYDEWFLRQGRYDHGAELNQAWFAEVEQVRAALAAFQPVGRVLELACGTGLWTQYLHRYAEHITALDSSPEVLELNRQRLDSDRVRYVQADLFGWEPDDSYDVVFFSFWLSHVPESHFAGFWEMVRRALKPGGRAFLIDSRYDPTTTARDHSLGGREMTTMTRRLNDGRTFEIVKIFYEPARLESQLQSLGWKAQAAVTPRYFLYAQAGRPGGG
jgi:demethylmenaquinone methyltransferase/2-methoxy-6-polyprenyl-1,4-benzoquinol methylase